MGTTLNPNILFRFSGVTLGEYIFPQNPMTMDALSPWQYSNVLTLLEGEDIYMRGFIDNEVRVMKWDEVEYTTYTGIKPYATRTASGTIPVTYFWDGTMNEFRGAKVHVIDVYSKPIAGKFNKWTMEIQIKPIRQD